MRTQEYRPTVLAECATCPDCQKVLVLCHLPPESKRPFVEGRAHGWVLICQCCGLEFPVRNSEIFQTEVEVQLVH